MKKVLLRSPIGPLSGYGNDGMGLASSFVAAGDDVYVLPFACAPPLPPHIAKLLTKALEPPFDLTLVHVDPEAIALTEHAQRATRRAVAWTMWEYPNFDHTPQIAEDLAERLSLFDLVLGYDHVTAEALAPFVDESRLHVLQGGFADGDWPLFEQREWFDDTFRFVMVGALHARKNPFVAIRAFNRLKDEHGDAFDAELHLKTVTRSLHPGLEQTYPGIKIHYETWPQAKLYALYASSHCLLAPSRGEGKNLPALEAQATGIPVIATDYGGHKMWLSEQYGYPLRYDLVEQEGVKWAQADEDHLTELMWQVYSNRAETRRRGLLAARTIPSLCGWDAVMRRFHDRLATVPEREPRLS